MITPGRLSKMLADARNWSEHVRRASRPSDTEITLQEIVMRRAPFMVRVGGKLYQISVKSMEDMER